MALAGGIEECLGRLRGIDQWFPKANQLNDAAFLAREEMSDVELLCCFSKFQSQQEMGVVLQAMLEVESLDPSHQLKWKLFKSLCNTLDPLRQAREPEVAAVMGLSASKSVGMPVDIIDDEREEMATPERKKRTKAEVTSLPRLSSRFPRRSPRLLVLFASSRRLSEWESILVAGRRGF
ncbi:hypothetical protein ZWY2020_049748 [Hordeum vulgare]|nr:hypothetical protein ZWY2020_049748 [Hordeum vulgare]